MLLVDGTPMSVAAVIDDFPTNSNSPGDVFGSVQVGRSPFKAFARAGCSPTPTGPTCELRPGATAASVAAGLPGFVRAPHAAGCAALCADELPISMWLKPLARIHLEPADQGDGKSGVDPRWWPPSASSAL